MRAFLLCLCVIAAVQVGAVPQLPASMMRGLNIMGFSSDVYTSASVLSDLKMLPTWGVEWVNIEPVFSQENQTASNVTIGDTTTSVESLVTAIKVAKAAGLRVLVKGFVLPVDGSSWMYIAPHDPASWFDSYGALLLQYFSAAAAAGAEAGAVGVELAHLAVNPMYSAYWPKLIGRLRAGLPKTFKLTYCSIYIVEYPHVTFWSLLDWIGIDGYWPMASAANPNPPVADMVVSYNASLQQVREWRASAGLTHIPVVITEVGFASYKTVAVTPSASPTNCSGEYAPDFQAQADAYEAMLTAVADNADLLAGLLVFWLDNPTTSDYYPSGRNYECFFTMRNKPAQAILQQAYGKPVQQH